MKKILFVLCMVLFANVMSAQEYVIEANAIGPVKVGLNYKELPKQVAGLYSEINVWENYDEMEDETSYTVLFMIGEDQILYANASVTGEIYGVRGKSKKLHTKSGAYPDMPAREFIAMPGAKTIFQPKADELYQVVFEIDGVPVNIERYHYTAAGERKIQKALRTKVAPKFTAADFTPDAWIFLGGY